MLRAVTPQTLRREKKKLVGEIAFMAPVLAAPLAAPTSLSCLTPGGVASLSMVFDYTGWQPGSGYFTVKHAKITDNYHQADLVCVGNTLSDPLSCVGYDNGGPDTIFNARITPGASAAFNSTASYSFVALDGPTGSPPQTPGPWPCTLGVAADPAPVPDVPQQWRATGSEFVVSQGSSISHHYNTAYDYLGKRHTYAYTDRDETAVYRFDIFDPAYPGARIPLVILFDSRGTCCYKQNVDAQGEQRHMKRLAVESGATDVGPTPIGELWTKTDSIVVERATSDWYIGANNTLTHLKQNVSAFGKPAGITWVNYTNISLGVTDEDFEWPGYPKLCALCYRRE
jgi:hypothetical protein